MQSLENTLPSGGAPVAPHAKPRGAAGASYTAPSRWSIWWFGLAGAVAWGVFSGMTLAWPNQVLGFSDWAYTDELGRAAALVAACLLVLGLAPTYTAVVSSRARVAGPWIVAIGVGLSVWEVVTAKLALLPTPFFAPPQSLIEVFLSDGAKLLDCAKSSLILLATGVSLGAAVGFVLGVWIGWSRQANYWIHPVLRVLGPLPTTALLPISFYFFPSSWSTAVFLIALGTGFPVAILTWSGVASVSKSYYDVARTLGASSWFLVLRVAIPAALPQVFVGLFMGLGHAFATLVVAEMLGVKSGLGWYLTWAQGWGSYPNMYGALLVMAVLFSSVISLLFLVRDRTLSWQKGIVKW